VRAAGWHVHLRDQTQYYPGFPFAILTGIHFTPNRLCWSVFSSFPSRATPAVLLAVAGGEPSGAAAVCDDGAKDCRQKLKMEIPICTKSAEEPNSE
jgi:hypothetical protein